MLQEPVGRTLGRIGNEYLVWFKLQSCLISQCKYVFCKMEYFLLTYHDAKLSTYEGKYCLDDIILPPQTVHKFIY